MDAPSPLSDRVMKIVARGANVAPATIEPHHFLGVDLHLYDLAAAEVMFAIDREIGVNISQSQWETLDRVQDLIACVQSMMQEA